MRFVLDASVAACWALQDEDDSRADAALRKMQVEEALVPTLWWFEIRNTLVVIERRKRIVEADTKRFLRELASLRICVDREPVEASVLNWRAPTACPCTTPPTSNWPCANLSPWLRLTTNSAQRPWLKGWRSSDDLPLLLRRARWRHDSVHAHIRRQVPVMLHGVRDIEVHRAKPRHFAAE